MAGVIVRCVGCSFLCFLLTFLGPPLYWGIVGRYTDNARDARSKAALKRYAAYEEAASNWANLHGSGGAGSAYQSDTTADLGGLTASADALKAEDDGDDEISPREIHEESPEEKLFQPVAKPEEPVVPSHEDDEHDEPATAPEIPDISGISWETPSTAPKAFQPIVEPKRPPVRSEDYLLTRERVAKHATSDGLIMVTWANYHYLDFALNWLGHLSRLGVKNVMVGAMDHEMLEALVERGVPTFSMESGLTTGDFGWGTPTFHKMGREKINLFVKFTEMGFDVLISDIDTVWLRDPLPYMAEYKNADVLTSSDHLSATTTDGGLESWPNAGSAANIGIMLFRRSANKLARKWLDMLEKDDKIWDQNAFNDLYRKGGMGGRSSENRVFKGYDGTLSFGILPVSLFCSGHTYFTQQMPMKMGVTPYVIHATFQYSGTDGKRHRFREHMIWDDVPEYYLNGKAGKGFLMYDADVPQELINNAKTSPEAHFELVNYQLLSVRSALALAQITGRALIMPKLWCGQDRWWAPHRGIIPGSQLKLPYECPMDHVFDIEWFQRQRDEKVFGPHIDFREYSFLDNPRMPDGVKQSMNIMRFQDTRDHGGAGGEIMTEAEFKEVHDAHHLGARVLRLDGKANKFFHLYSDPQLQQKFEMRLKEYASIWCCKHAHPGHIWYDFFFDIPHTDRHMRQWTGLDGAKPWTPVTGP
ncbi:glycosyltransferase family 77 protein [Pseudoscourfieldia marina]